MEIPEDKGPKKETPKPKKDAASTPEIDPAVLERREKVAGIVTNAGVGVIHSRSQIDMLSFLLLECEEAEKQRSPEDGPRIVDDRKSAVERFLLDPSKSPLVEAEEAEKFFQLLNLPVTALDETDTSGKTLGDFADPDSKKHLETLAESLKDSEQITERIRGLFIQSSPELIGDYQEYTQIIGPMSKEQNHSNVLGDSPSDKAQKEFSEVLDSSEKEVEAIAFLQAEKARLLCQAVTLPENTERKKETTEQCQLLFGADTLELINKQIAFSQKHILRMYAENEIPSSTPEELFCPEILQRMGDTGPSQQQLAALVKTQQAIQEFYALRREQGEPGPEELKYQVARIALAAMYVIEHGKWASHVNTLRQYREILSSKSKDFTPLLEANAEEPETAAPGTEIPNPADEREKKTRPARTPYQTKIAHIGDLITAHNAAQKDDAKKVDAGKFFGELTKQGATDLPGLQKLTVDNIVAAGAPNPLATRIHTLIAAKEKAASKDGKEGDKEKTGKEKKKPGVLKDAIKGNLKYQWNRLGTKVAGTIHANVMEEMLHTEGDIYGQNAGMKRQFDELGHASSMQIT